MPRIHIDARYGAWLAALLLLLALPLFAGFARLGWELAQLAGYLGAVLCILLTGAPVRPRTAVPPALVSLRLHTLLGWTALAAVGLHIGGLVAADPTVIEYLKPTAPLYQLAGMGATLVLLGLVLSGLAAARRRLWRSHRGFQATHIVMAYSMTLLIAAHVLVTARYLGGGGRRALFAVAVAGAMLMLLRARRPAAPAARQTLVFGRHSTLIAVAAAACAAAVVALVPGRVEATLREPLLPRAGRLPLDFPHEKHGAVNCLQCHHNYADGRGMEACIDCHRGARTDLAQGVEARFHGFCFDCHRHPGAALHTHGPVSGCSECHHDPAARLVPAAAP